MKILVDFKKVKTKKTTGMHSFFTYLKLVKMSIPVRHLKQYSDNGVPFPSNNKARGSLSSLRNTSHSWELSKCKHTTGNTQASLCPTIKLSPLLQGCFGIVWQGIFSSSPHHGREGVGGGRGRGREEWAGSFKVPAGLKPRQRHYANCARSQSWPVKLSVSVCYVNQRLVPGVCYKTQFKHKITANTLKIRKRLKTEDPVIQQLSCGQVMVNLMS